MSSPTSFQLAVAMWALGMTPSDDLPGVAADAIAAGIECPALLSLAASESTPDPDYHRGFERALGELGLEKPSMPQAGRTVIGHHLRMISSGKSTPIDGARAIWRVILKCPDLTREFGIFEGLASEYEDLPSLREVISGKILAEARTRSA